jgi:hypothetical protein
MSNPFPDKRAEPLKLSSEAVAELSREFRQKAIAHAQVGITFLTDASHLSEDKAMECFSEASRFAGMVTLLEEVEYAQEYDTEEE